MSIEARHIMTAASPSAGETKRTAISAGTHVIDILPRLLSSDDMRVDVVDHDTVTGSVDADRLLRALGDTFPYVNESSLIEAECDSSHYMASEVARAVEDTDTVLIGMWSRKETPDTIKILIRVARRDPWQVVRSLERYGYDVTFMDYDQNIDAIHKERIDALRLYLGIGQHANNENHS